MSSQARAGGRGVPALFTLAVFVAATLLFAVQPLFARQLLPRVGGAPAVWTTALLFFQLALLAGYALAHAQASVRDPRAPLAQLALVALASLALPLAVHGAPPSDGGDPRRWVLVALLASVGAPFVALATSGPLLQRWLADARPDASPYPLYAASNLGSLVGLLGYPLLVEPTCGLRAQVSLFSGGFALFATLTLACATVRLRARSAEPARARAPDPTPPISARTRARWIALAVVPSCLMLGATTYVGTDLAAAPLLWVPPLALYLISFIVVFARARGVAKAPGIWPRLLFLALALPLFFFALPRIRQHVPVALAHLALCFVGGLVFHGELARTRPSPARLTDFYLSIALGGALGGLACSLLAPLVLRGTYEYPLAIAAAIALLPGAPRSSEVASERARAAAFARSLGVGAEAAEGPKEPRRARRALDALVPLAALGLALWLGAGHPATPLTVGAPMVLVIACSLRAQARLGAGMAAIVLAVALQPGALYLDRTFFGVLRVDRDRETRTLFHGTTIHGVQRDDRPREPLLYYARGAPVGRLFDALGPALDGAEVGVVGLGVGALAAYARPGQRWTFYEIDDGVRRAAEQQFTFLRDARAPIEIVLGDARVSLGKAPPGRFRLLVLDAFSSDAVPTHLLTREAFALYASRLAEGGVLVVHASNRYVRLDAVAAAAARSLGLAARVAGGVRDDPSDPSRAIWLALARTPGDLRALDADPRWRPIEAGRGLAGPLWTDDFSDLIGSLTLRAR